MSLRKEIETDIIDLMDTLDPSGKNTERMKKFFNTMDDKKFYKFYYEFFKDEDKNFKIAYVQYEHEVTCSFIHKAAKKYDIPIHEIVYMPYAGDDPSNPPGTLYPVTVLDYPMKRLKQMGIIKNHTSELATHRSTETGQVSGHDKIARETDMETYSLIVQEQYAAAREYYGPQSDDLAAKNAMLRDIRVNGQVSLDDLPNDPANKVMLNTMNYYMLGAGFETNFINENGYLLPITVKNKEEAQTRIKR